MRCLAHADNPMRQHQPADDHDGGKDLRRFGRRVFSATLTRVCNWPEEGMTFDCLNSTVVSGARSRDCLLSSQAYRRRARNDPPDPRQVRTKNAKTFTSVFFPVSDDFHDIAVNWIRYLREENGFGPDHPLIPRPRSRTAATSNFAVSRPHLETSLHDPEQVFSLRLLLEVPATYSAT